MSEVFVLPVIRRQDYEAFRRDIGPKLAGSYDEWTKLVAAEIAQARLQGKTVVEADVDYSAFVRYCNAAGKKPDAVILAEFAAHRPLGEA